MVTDLTTLQATFFFFFLLPPPAVAVIQVMSKRDREKTPCMTLQKGRIKKETQKV